MTFREDNPNAKLRTGVYEQALAFSEQVDTIIETVLARFHLKDLLDKSATVVALRIAQAASETSKPERRRQYRVARRAATDCAAVLDILARRKGVDPGAIAPARQQVMVLVSELAHLSSR